MRYRKVYGYSNHDIANGIAIGFFFGSALTGVVCYLILFT